MNNFKASFLEIPQGIIPKYMQSKNRLESYMTNRAKVAIVFSIKLENIPSNFAI